jgi:glucose/mannose-6-phosphate isomerase
MSDLDNVSVYGQIDPADMRGQIRGMPKQCHKAWHKALEFDLPSDYRDVDKVVVLGMGGSAIGGNLVRSLVSEEGKVVISVNRDYDLPAFVDERTLVIASSYSGNTEETLSAFGQALNIECKKLAITTGGALEPMAKEAHVPVFPIEHISPPRAALGYSFMPLLAFLKELEFVDDIHFSVEDMIDKLEELNGRLNVNVSAKRNEAKQLAHEMCGKLVVVYGAGILSEVAHRWKTQINENSKAWAVYETLPELNHNSVVGYPFPVDIDSDLYVVMLQAPSLHPRIMMRYKVTAELLEQRNIKPQLVAGEGGDTLSQMMSALFIGDWASFYLAVLYDIDPTPVKTVDYLKKRLSEIE